MPTFEEYENSMTLYFSKRNGEIISYSTGIQDMSFFGDNQPDYEIIWDFIVVAKDQVVLDNTRKFKINLNTRQLEIKPESVQQYPVAQA